MTDRDGKSHWLLEGLHELLLDESSLHFSDFEEVSESFIEGYTRFVKLGLPGQTVGLAMLAATINMYGMFGMRQDLPSLFRTLADKIEAEESRH